jgi:tryptophanase
MGATTDEELPGQVVRGRQQVDEFHTEHPGQMNHDTQFGIARASLFPVATLEELIVVAGRARQVGQLLLRETRKSSSVQKVVTELSRVLLPGARSRDSFGHLDTVKVNLVQVSQKNRALLMLYCTDRWGSTGDR